MTYIRKSTLLLGYILILLCISNTQVHGNRVKKNSSLDYDLKKLGIYIGNISNSYTQEYKNTETQFTGSGFSIDCFWAGLLNPYLDIEITLGYHQKKY